MKVGEVVNGITKVGLGGYLMALGGDAKNITRQAIIESSPHSTVAIDAVPNGSQAAMINLGLHMILSGLFPRVNNTLRIFGSTALTIAMSIGAETVQSHEYGFFNFPDLALEVGGAIASGAALLLVDKLAHST